MDCWATGWWWIACFDLNGWYFQEICILVEANSMRLTFCTIEQFLTDQRSWVWIFLAEKSKPVLTALFGCVLCGYEGRCNKYKSRPGQRNPRASVFLCRAGRGSFFDRGAHTFRVYPGVPIVRVYSRPGQRNPPASVFPSRAVSGVSLPVAPTHLGFAAPVHLEFTPFTDFAAEGVR